MSCCLKNYAYNIPLRARRTVEYFALEFNDDASCMAFCSNCKISRW